MDLDHLLQRHFGHSAFRSGQETVVRALLEGRSALALFPTGAGKSLCYQLPALVLDGVTLVISPLIALMQDQVGSLRARGVAAARLDSSLTQEEARAVLDDLQQDRLKLLFIAPERLLSEAFMERLRRVKIALLAVDEAHCISEWGHNFRPEYLRLALAVRQLAIRPVLALTATATPAVAQDICRAFDIAEADQVRTSFLRPNLRYRITPCAAEERLERLTQALRKQLGPAIVYVTLQSTAEQVATHLQRQGLAALAYHAGLPDAYRHEAQEAFMSGRASVMVATIAFGMGIDKADIRAVYHYNLPKSLENYVQETGRAGRDGEPSWCELFACVEDRTVLENFTYGDTPTTLALRQLTDHLLRQGETFDLSIYELSQATDIRPLVVETVLTHLELQGVLQPVGRFYSSYQFRLLQPLDRVLVGHSPDRQDFLRRLFAAGSKGPKWTTVQPEVVAASLGETNERVIKALTWLQEAGEIELKPSGLRQRYRRLDGATAQDPFTVAQGLEQLFQERERRDLERLDQVLALAREPGCLVRHLLSHFGEMMDADCGCCGRCEDRAQEREPILELPGEVASEISAESIVQIRQLCDERHAALRSPRQLARFLCGLSSPATTRARLTRHDAFGLLEKVPFRDVLAQVEAMLG